MEMIQTPTLLFTKLNEKSKYNDLYRIIEIEIKNDDIQQGYTSNRQCDVSCLIFHIMFCIFII